MKYGNIRVAEPDLQTFNTLRKGKKQRLFFHELLNAKKDLRTLKSEVEKLREDLPKGTHEQWREIGCKALLQFDYKNMVYHCAIKAPKTTVIPSLKICEFCWARQQTQKAQKVPERSIPAMYTKPEKIYCLGLTRWVDPLKTQAMCYRCKTQTLERYAECQQKRLTT